MYFPIPLAQEKAPTVCELLFLCKEGEDVMTLEPSTAPLVNTIIFVDANYKVQFSSSTVTFLAIGDGPIQ